MSGITSKGEMAMPSGSVGLKVAGPRAVMQPGRKISYKADGTGEGSVTWECKKDAIADLPIIGSTHPDDPSLICHHMEATFMALNKVKLECFYHGISFTFGEVSRPIIDYQGGVDTVPITAHPVFTDLAGTPSAPNHGAFWRDPVTLKRSTNDAVAEFAGFTDPADTEFFGVEHFFVNRPLVSRTVWSKTIPQIQAAMTIVEEIPGFTNPPNIRNWLLMDTPYRQVGNIYQITEQYKGAPDPGWSEGIYNQL